MSQRDRSDRLLLWFILLELLVIPPAFAFYVAKSGGWEALGRNAAAAERARQERIEATRREPPASWWLTPLI
jgi:hypothetical protein